MTDNKDFVLPDCSVGDVSDCGPSTVVTGDEASDGLSVGNAL